MKKRPNRFLFTYLWTFPWDIIVWFVVLVMWVFFGKKLHWCEGLWCELKSESIISKKWNYAGITLGHGGLYGDGYSGGKGVDTDTEVHELIHVEQYEVSMCVAFVAAQIIFWSRMDMVGLFFGAIFWVAGWGIVYGAASLQAWLRGENYYTGNVFEESAYSQADQKYAPK